MNPNLSTGYEATRTERSRLTSQAERGWQTEQAASSRPRNGFMTMCQRAGARLALASEHLRHVPRGTQHPATKAGSSSRKRRPAW
ncbi:MAG: hypothetical protein H0T93_12315 [Chloroflexia bacterium]|nr:hypothetical protein [Chloroflexia bacterium]